MKKIILFALFVLIFFGFANAGSVTRSFSSITVEPNQTATITLAISPGNETFYLLDEIIPSGWTIIDAGTGATEQQSHIKWVVIQNAKNAAYTYTVKAPSSEGTANFSGKYLFEGGSETEIAGEKTVTVAKAGPVPQAPEPKPALKIDSTLFAGALVIGIILIIAGVLILKKKKKK